MEWIVVKTFASLTAVVGLMFVVVLLMKKFVYGNRASSGNIVDMRVIGTMLLQPKRSVSLLKVMDKVLIIGFTEDGMRTLGEITDERNLQLIDAELAREAAQPKLFGKKNEGGSRFSFADALALQISKLKTGG